jgi:predicted nucleic acid-binding protein
MSLVVDASVFVAASRKLEAHYPDSVSFIRRVVNETVHCPWLVIPECAAAIMRATNDVAAAEKILQRLRDAFWLRLVPLNDVLASKSADAAIQCRTRGADSCYVALAEQLGAVLVTWDREMLQRGAHAVTTMTPADWLQQQAQVQDG